MTSHSRFDALRISDSSDDDDVDDNNNNVAAVMDNDTTISNNNNNNNNTIDIINNINNNISNTTNNNSSINFVSQSINADKSEVRKGDTNIQSGDVCNDLFSVTNVTETLIPQATKISAPVNSAVQHVVASQLNTQDYEEKEEENDDVAYRNHRNVIPLITNQDECDNLNANEPYAMYNVEHSATPHENTNNTDDNDLNLTSAVNTSSGIELRRKHKRVRRNKEAIEPNSAASASSLLLTTNSKSNTHLTSLPKTAATATRNENKLSANIANYNNTNNTINNINNNVNSTRLKLTTTHATTGAEQEKSIAFEEVIPNQPLTSLSSINDKELAVTKEIKMLATTNRMTSDNNNAQSSSSPSSLLQYHETTLTPSNKSSLMPRRNPVIPSPSELEEAETGVSLLSSSSESLSAPKVRGVSSSPARAKSPRGKVLPVINSEGKEVWMMTVESHKNRGNSRDIRATMANVPHDACNNSNGETTNNHDNKIESEYYEEEEEEEENQPGELIVKPLFEIRPPPRHLSRRAQNIMEATVHAMRSEIRQRHTAAIKAAVQQTLSTTHQVCLIPNLFIYSLDVHKGCKPILTYQGMNAITTTNNNNSNSNSLTSAHRHHTKHTYINNISASLSSSVSASASASSSLSLLLPPPHMRIVHNNDSLSPHERE